MFVSQNAEGDFLREKHTARRLEDPFTDRISCISAHPAHRKCIPIPVRIAMLKVIQTCPARTCLLKHL